MKKYITSLRFYLPLKLYYNQMGKNEDQEILKKKYAKHDVEITRNGSAGVVQIKVPNLDVHGSFENQKTKVIEGLEAALKLLKIYNAVQKA